MSIDRVVKLARKFTKIVIMGIRPSAIFGAVYGPKVIINSIPKSGTNLVQEILHRFPLLRGGVTRTLTSKVDAKVLARRLRNIKRGQCLPAHIFYSKEVEDILFENDIKMIFVIRDFRDAILSHINYIDRIDVTHPHHELFSSLKTLDEKIDVCLKGIPGRFLSWPDLVDGFKGWVKSNRVLIVRFEDVIGRYGGGDAGKQYEAIAKIAEFLKISRVNINEVVEKIYDENGLTFNAPSIGKWQKFLSVLQIERINSCLGKDLEYFGYKE